MKPIGKKKQGFATVNQIVGGALGFAFLVVFGLVFITQLVDTNLLTSGSAEENATTNLRGNITDGVDQVSVQIPTVFKIAVFILIITVLLLAYILARRNGIIGGSGALG